MSNLNCNGCLTSNRKLSPLKPEVTDIFTMLCPDRCLHISRYLICWECEFMIDKIKLFEARLRKANDTLKLYMEGKVAIVEELSRLKLTGIESISIPPKNTHTLLKHILQQNTPTLHHNTSLLQQTLLQDNTPTLQQSPTIQNTPTFLHNTPTIQNTPTFLQNTPTIRNTSILQKTPTLLQNSTPEPNTPTLLQNTLTQHNTPPPRLHIPMIEQKAHMLQYTPIQEKHTPTLQQNTPTLLQNSAPEQNTLQQNSPTLLNTPTQQNTPTLLHNTLTNSLPQLHTPILELTPTLQITPTHRTDPFRSLRDMLAAPLRLETTVKVENHRCDRDYDDLIQPTIMFLNADDPPQSQEEPVKDEPEVYEIVDEISVKDEPIIRQKPVNAPTEQGKPVVTENISNAVEEPLIVTRAETAPIVTNQVCELNLEKLLTKLLTAPSNSEKLFTKPRASKESEKLLTKQSASKESEKLPERDTQNTDLNTKAKLKRITLSRPELDAIREKKRKHSSYLKAAFKCEKCLESYPCLDKLLEHERRKHDESQGPVVCDICEQRFTDDELRNEHYQQHFVAYRCIKCPYQVCSATKLANHIRENHEESCFYCKKCNTSFKTFKERHKHNLQTHEKKIKCEECRKPITRSFLRIHMANVHRVTMAECPICKKNFRKNYLKKHMRTHKEMDMREDLPYCADCDTYYSSKDTYTYHLRTTLKHNSIEKLGIKCEHCNKLFTSKKTLKSHIDEIIGVKYTCDICKVDRKTRKTLVDHIRVVHEGRKRKINRRICETCGKSFSKKKTLEEHVNSHLGHRPHECEKCGAKFVYSASLKQHWRIIHKVKKTETAGTNVQSEK